MREDWKSKTKEDKGGREDEGIKQKKGGMEKEEDETVVKRKYVNPVSVDAFDIFSQGEISECGSVVEPGKWSSALVSNDKNVLPSFAVEVVGVGEVSGSVWELGSACGSIAVSGVPVVPDVGVTAPSAVMCGGVPSDSEWDFVEPQSFFFLQEA